MKKETIEQLNKILMEEGYRIVPVNKTTVIIEGNVSIPSLDGDEWEGVEYAKCVDWKGKLLEKGRIYPLKDLTDRVMNYSKERGYIVPATKGEWLRQENFYAEYLKCVHEQKYVGAAKLGRIYTNQEMRDNYWSPEHFAPSTKEEWLTQKEKDQFEVGGFARPLITCGAITKNRIVRINKIEQKNNDGNWHLFFDTEEGEMFSHISNFVPATKEEWLVQEIQYCEHMRCKYSSDYSGAPEFSKVYHKSEVRRNHWSPEHFEPATKEDWLRQEAKERYGEIKKGDVFKLFNGSVHRIINEHPKFCYFDFEYSGDYEDCFVVSATDNFYLPLYEGGKWAKKVPPEVEVGQYIEGGEAVIRLHNGSWDSDSIKMLSDFCLKLKRKLNE